MFSALGVTTFCSMGKVYDERENASQHFPLKSLSHSAVADGSLRDGTSAVSAARQ
ncbi:MAG: hypothetical protein WCN98_16380 [Verrucomicrobiaceae bacterium]